jgi:archaemetzincin
MSFQAFNSSLINPFTHSLIHFIITLNLFQNKFSLFLNMNLRHITLISYGHFEKGFVEIIADSVKHEFSYLVNTEECHLDLSRFYDPSRRQYDGNRLLHEIDSNFSSGSLKTIGLFRVDLFIPILTYIYGQAFLNGRSAIASLFRLNNERYGMPMDEDILLERFKKEVIHELGHTFGLKHCHIPTCVMKSSTYVEDIDQKSNKFCNNCREELKG